MSFTTALLVLLAAQEAAPEFTRFEIARERIEHKAIVEAVLSNVAGPDLADVQVVIIYFDVDREVRRSAPVAVGSLPNGKSVIVKIETTQVANFNRFDVRIDAGPKRYFYESTDTGKFPVPKKAPPAKLALALAPAPPPASFPADVTLSVTVRNSGEGDARDPVAVVTFQKDGEARTLRIRLADAVERGAEDTFQLTIPRCAAFDSVEVEPAWLSAALSLPPGKIGQGKEVEVGRIRVGRLTDGSLRMSGALRNGLAEPILRPKITFKLGANEYPCTVPGEVKAGSLREFEFFIARGPAKVDPFGYSLGFETSDSPAAMAPPPVPQAKLTAHKPGAVRTEEASAPPPAAEKPADPKAPKGPALTVRLAGVVEVKGKTLKNNLYTGDTFFLCLVFRDGEGKPVQPLGTLTAVCFNGDAPFKRVPRNITKESWKANASKITPDNVSNEAVAFDEKTGELWVGLIRTDGPYFELRADVSLVVKGMGTWTWKKLSEKFESPARGPDEK